MKPINIYKDVLKVDKLLNDLQKRTKSRNITIHDIYSACLNVQEKVLKRDHELEGTEFTFDKHASVNNHSDNYYYYKSTQIHCRYHDGEWYLIDVYRDTVCHPYSRYMIVFGDTKNTTWIDCENGKTHLFWNGRESNYD